MLARRSAAVLLTASLVALASGCSDDDAPADAPGGAPGDGQAEPSGLCLALSPDQLSRVVGGAAPEALPDGTGTRCHWQSPDERRSLVAFVMPADEWAAALPSSLPQLKVNRDLSAKERRLVERLEREVAGEDMSAERACEIFVDVARLSGAERESGAMVNFVPAGAVNPHQGVTAQRCEDGRFASLTAYSAASVPDRATARRTARALGALLQRVG